MTSNNNKDNKINNNKDEKKDININIKDNEPYKNNNKALIINSIITI